FTEKDQIKPDLLLTDVIMPEMNGKILYEELRKKFPALKVLFMSGYTANVIAHNGILDKGIHFIEKPFTSKALLKKIEEIE
ncbi:MAG: response regulator, partial [Thermoanaerobaculaceae bacterium]|nr:response regulator [Thermoanaerobaculaceae bacterium]